MKHHPIFLILIVFGLTLVACQPEVIVTEVSASHVEAAAPSAPAPAQLIDSNNNPAIEYENTCQNPSPEMAPTCAAIEEQILAATVRIELLLWDEANGQRGDFIDGGTAHATVIDGRHLVTHNHFPLPLESIAGSVEGERIRLSIYKANGEAFLTNLRPSDYTLVAEDSETLVINFDNYFGDIVSEGLFAYLGIPSAKYGRWPELSLAPGMEVAQINWDNDKAFVQWVNIQTVSTSNGTPHIELTNGVIKGASGGGIFWNGLHIGNNWSSSEVREAAGGDVLDTYSAAALNAAWGLAE